MTELINLFALTCITGLLSFTIFVVCLKHAPSSANYNIEIAFREANFFMRKLMVLWRKSKRVAIMTCILTLWIYYINMKRRNAIGFVDTSIVGSLTILLGCIVTVDIYDVLNELIKWLRESMQ
jgi:hypothetical protein